MTARAAPFRLLTLLLLTLCGRLAAVPGWMPVAGDHGLTIAMCHDGARVAVPGDFAPADHGDADAPCPFGAVSAAPALTAAAPSPPLPPVVVARAALPVAREAHAPRAPPHLKPPATGPPLLG